MPIITPQLATWALVTMAVGVLASASAPFDDPERGAPFDPTAMKARLSDLAAFAATIASVRASTTADTAGGACDESSGLRCAVDLIDSNNQIQASVVVYWLSDGVTDFSIVVRSASGRPAGIGRAGCSAGYELVHGGHTPDRFDVALCADASGRLEYNGIERKTDRGIKLAPCPVAPDQWEVTNDGFRYLVNGAISATRSQLEVYQPDGKLIYSGQFTTVRFPPLAPLVSC